jgi:hypothetical protein
MPLVSFGNLFGGFIAAIRITGRKMRNNRIAEKVRCLGIDRMGSLPKVIGPINFKRLLFHSGEHDRIVRLDE